LEGLVSINNSSSGLLVIGVTETSCKPRVTLDEYGVIGFNESADDCRNKSDSVLTGEKFLNDRYFH
jgi:hypothetical protein